MIKNNTTLKDYADADGDIVSVFAESFHSSDDTKPDGTQKKDLGEFCSFISQCLLTLKHSRNRD